MSVVALSVTVSLIGTRYTRAIMAIWAEGEADHGTGHAQLHVHTTDGGLGPPSVATTMPVGQPLEAALAADPAVSATSQTLHVEGLISSGTKTIYFFGTALDGDRAKATSPKIFQAKDQGHFIDAHTERGAVIGKGLAETLDLKLGDSVTLLTTTSAGGSNGIDLNVIGIVDPGYEALSKRLVFMSLADGQRAMGLPDRYSDLVIRLKPTAKAEPWVAAHTAQATSAGLDLRGWWQINPVIKKVEAVWEAVVQALEGMLFFTAAMSILNIVFALVAERTVEIGMLMAIGARTRDIRTLFTLEAGLIGLFGGLIGAAVGNAIVLTMGTVGVPFDSPFGSERVIVRPEVSPMITLLMFGVAIVICCLAATLPARRAANTEPVVAFRGQIT